MPWQSAVSGATTILQTYLCQAVCRLHELIVEHVEEGKMLFILRFLSEAMISQVCFTNVDTLMMDNLSITP